MFDVQINPKSNYQETNMLDRFRSNITMFLLLGVLAACGGDNVSQTVAEDAQTVDSSYTFAAYGNKVRVGGKDYYPAVSFHKVFLVDGRPIVCGRITPFPHEKFYGRGRLVSSSNNTIIWNLDGLGFFRPPNKIQVEEQNYYPGNLASYVGMKVNCKVSREDPLPEFTDGRSAFEFPQKIRYKPHKFLK